MKILAFGAHPDDIEFGGAAPLIIKETKKGNKAKVVICSLGEAGTNGTPAGRKKESQTAAKILGSEIEFINLGGDCHIQNTPLNAKYKPDIILTTSLKEEQHPDHRILAILVRDACRFARYGKLKELQGLPVHKIKSLFYYQSSADYYKPFDIVIDVSKIEQTWIKAISAHKSQMKKDYLDLVLTKARALGASIGVKYAVGLWKNDPLRINSLSDISLSSRNY